MPESGPVVRALEWFVSHSHEDVCSCSCTMNTDPNGFAEAALDLAREQEVLLREYIVSHMGAWEAWTLGKEQECACVLCKRARKVLA